MEKGVVRFKQLFPQDIADKITIIHVLNPSALIAPQNNIQDEIEAIVRIQRTKEKYDGLIADVEQQGQTEARDILISLRDKYISEQLVGLRIEDIDLEVPRPFPGLNEFINKENVVSDIEYDDFIKKIGKTIANHPNEYLASVFDHIYQTQFNGRGRPRNLLLISTHDPKLRGYTENLSNVDLETIRKRILHIQHDVSKFLESLT